jgi:hypothetical protein
VHYRAYVSSRTHTKTDLAFTIILDVLKASVRFFIFARAAELSHSQLGGLFRVSFRVILILFYLRILCGLINRAYSTEPIHLLFDFVLEHLKLICIDELGERIDLLLVKKRYEVVTKTPHFAVSVQYKLIFETRKACTF